MNFIKLYHVKNNVKVLDETEELWVVYDYYYSNTETAAELKHNFLSSLLEQNEDTIAQDYIFMDRLIKIDKQMDEIADKRISLNKKLSHIKEAIYELNELELLSKVNLENFRKETENIKNELTEQYDKLDNEFDEILAKANKHNLHITSRTSIGKKTIVYDVEDELEFMRDIDKMKKGQWYDLTDKMMGFFKLFVDTSDNWTKVDGEPVNPILDEDNGCYSGVEDYIHKGEDK